VSNVSTIARRRGIRGQIRPIIMVYSRVEMYVMYSNITAVVSFVGMC